VATDWVYEKLLGGHKPAHCSILIDATGRRPLGFLMIYTRWPILTGLTCVEKMPRPLRVVRSSLWQRIQQRIIGSIQQSERASVFEDPNVKEADYTIKFWLSATLSLL